MTPKPKQNKQPRRFLKVVNSCCHLSQWLPFLVAPSHTYGICRGRVSSEDLQLVMDGYLVELPSLLPRVHAELSLGSTPKAVYQDTLGSLCSPPLFRERGRWWVATTKNMAGSLFVWPISDVWPVCVCVASQRLVWLVHGLCGQSMDCVAE